MLKRVVGTISEWTRSNTSILKDAIAQISYWVAEQLLLFSPYTLLNIICNYFIYLTETQGR